MLKFCPIASGSNGNCVFISDGQTSALIDAGLSGRAIEAGLNAIGETCANISALFITHEHSDHISGAGVLARRYGIPIYASEGTWAAMDALRLGAIKESCRQYVYPGGVTRVGGLAVSPFPIPHDAGEPLAMRVLAGGYAACVATDLGHVTDGICECLADADVILVEGNHDVDMLRNGPYPQRLKRRILGDNGHMSNAVCGELLCEMYTERLKSVYIGHLSAENNTPLLAFATVENILRANRLPVGESFRLQVARRGAPSAVTVLGSAAV